MRRAHRLCVLVPGTIAIVLGTSLAAVAQTEPALAEVARQEVARRKALVSLARVYTNDDLKHARPLTTAAAAPAPAPSSATGGAAAPGQAAPDARSGASEQAEALAQRLLAARDGLASARATFEAAQMRVGALTAEWVGAPDEATRAAIARARDAAAADFDRLRGEIDAQARALAQLEQDVLKQVRPVPPPK